MKFFLTIITISIFASLVTSDDTTITTTPLPPAPASPESQQSRIRDSRNHFDECIKELNIPDSEIKYYNTPNLPEDTPIGNCLVKCVMEKEGFFETDTGFQVEKLYKESMFSRIFRDDLSGQFLEMIKECVQSADENQNVCKRAYLGFKCLKDKNEQFSREIQKNKLN
ncbi:general odorant-binding protein 99a-like [Eupeodes corollae]|uniref:general odorant-binding protein 99a-like n=1 Tax=Eupeodes corollae TaxID=290404 RepID=UPI0024903472|nr:general odorant-binding protein 99a-like [Eupeodes corollae]